MINGKTYYLPLFGRTDWGAGAIERETESGRHRVTIMLPGQNWKTLYPERAEVEFFLQELSGLVKGGGS